MSKYTQGLYAVCGRCGERPCSCTGDDAAPAEVAVVKPANVEPWRATPKIRPSSGNAIPFAAFDAFPELTPTDRLVLLYLCRLTVGYGHHTGDLLSLGLLSARTGLSRHAVREALNVLEENKLIERSRRFERASRERATTHIRVTLPDAEVGPDGSKVGPHGNTRVGPQRPYGRAPKAQGLGPTGPYLKDVPKSLPEEVDSPRKAQTTKPRVIARVKGRAVEAVQLSLVGDEYR